MDWSMGKASSSILKVICIKELMNKESDKAMDATPGLMETNMLVFGKTTNDMDKDSLLKPTAAVILGVGRTT